MKIRRTANFYKDVKNNEVLRIRRIPWDLLDIEGVDEFFVSPVPVSECFDGKVQTAEYFPRLFDMQSDEVSKIGADGEFSDEVVKFNFFPSEEQFYALFDNSFGFYKNDISEFGG